MHSCQLQFEQPRTALLSGWKWQRLLGVTWALCLLINTDICPIALGLRVRVSRASSIPETLLACSAACAIEELLLLYDLRLV